MWEFSDPVRAVLTDPRLAEATVTPGALDPWIDVTVLRLIVVPLLALAPGYALVAAIWPAEQDATDRGIGRAERLGLSAVASAVLLTLTGMALNAAAIPLTPAPFLVVLGGATLVGIAVGAWRRRGLSLADRPAPSTAWRPTVLGFSRPETPKDWIRLVTGWRPDIPGLSRPETRNDWVLFVFLVAVLVVAVSSVGVAMTHSATDDTYSEFYLLTPNGSDSAVMADYPTGPATDTASVLVGVENHEGHTVSYTVVVERHGYAQRDGSLEIDDERELRRFRATVDDGQTWETEHELPTGLTDQPVQISYLLYRGEPPSDPSPETAYRQVSLWIGDESADETAIADASTSE